jgi:hypothetical protein
MSTNPSKRKYDEIDHKIGQEGPLPKRGFTFASQPSSSLGLIWDRENWSYAYDSVLVIVYYLWQDKPDQWSVIFEKTNSHLTFLSHGFRGIFNKILSMSEII